MQSSEQSIYLRAISLDTPAAQAAYLDEVCRDNPTLRKELDALLAAHDRLGAGPVPDNSDSQLTLQRPAAECAGTVIGSYKLIEPIGEGGMGTVWMAQQNVPVKRLVALKLIKSGLDSRSVIARFEAERQALALMDHPNIAKVLDGGTVGKDEGGRRKEEKEQRLLSGSSFIPHPSSSGEAGRPYFVMELVKGVPITRYCDEHHLTPRQRLELFVPVCQAIQHAHQKGIIHRDIKPSNVLVALYDDKPVPKIIDFGVAKATGQQLTELTLNTGFGAVVGTLEYMSPEQAGFNQLDIDTRSDIYSLGVLLYELLAGSPPFTRKDLADVGMLEMLRVIREQEPSKPSTKLSSSDALPSLSANRGTEPARLTKLVRGELDWIVMKALEKDRARRYETANGFAADLQRYLNDEQVQACPPSAGYRFRKFARRNRVAFNTAAVVLAALVLGIAVSTWQAIRATHAEDLAETRLEDETKAKGQAVASQLAAEQAQQDEATQRAIAEKRKTEADEQRKIAENSKAEADEQRAEAERLSKIATTNEKRAKEQEALARRRFYAAQINLALQAGEAGQPARSLELLESQRPKLDEDDLRGFDWYYLWRLCHGKLHRTLNAKGEVIYALAITPDGKTLVSGSKDGSIRVWDVVTGNERAVLSGHTTQIWRLAISPDGKMVASGSMDNTVKLWDLGTSELLATLAGRTQMVRSVAFSPDGKVLAVGTEDCALELWDVATRKRRLTLPALSAPALALAYSPGGKMLATGRGWNDKQVQGGVKVWDATLEPPRMIFQRDLADCAAFSPDSKLLATCSVAGVKVWNVPAGELKATFDSSGSGVWSAAFSADGNTLVLGCYDRTVKLWDFATGATRTVGVHLGAVNAVTFIPHSDLLASGGNDGAVKIWHAGPLQDTASFANKSVIRSLTFTPDSKRLVVGSDDITSLLDATTGKEMTTLPVAGVVAASVDANHLAGWAPDDKRVIWDVAAARAQAVLPVGHSIGPRLSGAAFSNDSKTLMTWIGDSEAVDDVRLWDLATSRVRLTLKKVAGHTYCAAISPDGRTFATAQQFGRIDLWDAANGQRRITLQQYEGSTVGAWAVVFSNNGKLVAAGNSEGMLRLWDVETGRLNVSFKGHAETIRSVAFSPDDRTLLSGSADRTARLWDVVTGQELLTLKEHSSPVHLVAFAPDGKRLATASHTEVKLWVAATEREATAFRVELDPDDSDSPRAGNNWGDRLQNAHRPQEAEQAFRQALVRLEKLAAALPDVPDYQAELAYGLFATNLIKGPASPFSEATYQSQLSEIWRGLPADRQIRLGERLLTRAIELQNARRYPESLKVFEQLTSLLPDNVKHWHQFGYTLHLTGQSERAIAAYSKAIEVDPTSASSWNNRAVIYSKLRQPDKAIADYRQAIALKPNDAILVANLGTDLQQQGKLEDALEVLRQGLEALGPDEPDGLKVQIQLADLYRLREKLPEEIRLREQIRGLQLKSLGPYHADTLAATNNLAAAYWRNQQLDRSIPLFEETVRLERANLPPNHPDTYMSIGNLGVNYREAGRLDEALLLLEEVVEWSRKQPGHVKIRFAWVLATLGGIYEQDQQFEVAEPLARESLAMRERAEPDIWTTFSTKSMLGGCLLGQEKYAEAEPLLLDGYTGMKLRQAKIPTVGKVRFVEALERLVRLYDASGRPDEAAKWRKELEDNGDLAASALRNWIRRGRRHTQSGEHEKAQVDFAQAFKLDPEHPLCRFERTKQNGKACATWDFSQGASGWTAGLTGRLTAESDALIMDAILSDPMFFADVSAPAGRKVLTFCTRLKSEMNCQIFWQSKTATAFTEEKSVYFKLPSSDGKWQEIPVPFEAEAELVRLRFDLPNEGDSKLEVAWMILADNPPRKSGEAKDKE